MTNPGTEDFLEKIRSLDRPTKRNIMIISTIITMALVLFLWLIYFDNITGNMDVISSNPAILASKSSSADQSGAGSSDIFAAAWSSLWGSAVGIWRSATDVFESAKEYNVTPKQ